MMIKPEKSPKFSPNSLKNPKYLSPRLAAKLKRADSGMGFQIFR